MKTQHYETDLSDEQFALLEPFLPKPRRMGRPTADLRRVVNGILHLVRTGCQWRLLPKEFSPWSTVHAWRRRWRRDGTWEDIHETPRRQVRIQAGRAPSPRSSAVDSRSVKTPPSGGESGFDAGKKVKGQKRHIGVDSLGLLPAVAVTTADVSDARAACDLLHRRSWHELSRLEVVYADNGYRAGCLREEVFEAAPFRLHVVGRPADAKGFVLLPQRWVVERTFAWLGRSRRLAKDCEHRVESSEAMIEISMIHLMLGRLAAIKEKGTQRFRYAA